MSRKGLMAALCVVAAGMGGLAGSIAIAQQSQDKPGQPQMQLPPGWTEADMQACMAAGTPGKQHEYLAKAAGTWQGKCTMWMAPETEPSMSECTTTITPIMDGRFTRCEVKGEMPGMGPFNGLGISGYDNVEGRFVSSWIDNCGTGIMQGRGELSPDGKVLTWTFNYTCPITKKPATMRQVETTTGANTMTLEMFATDPKSGQEYKMMSIDYTRKP